MASENFAIEEFREYLRIRSTTLENPDYESIEKFVKRVGSELGLNFRKIEQKFGDLCRPIFVLTLTGRDPSLGALILNGHFDVVPVYRDQWTHDPFAADLVDGKIYSRGAQDMKCVSIQYLNALRRLLNEHKSAASPFLRTIHICFTPDEEIGGPIFGTFVLTPEFRSLHGAFALDEGIASQSDTYRVFYAEKQKVSTRFTITGTSGHGSQFLVNTAGEKLRRLLDIAYDFRESEEKRMREGLPFGQVIVANLTMLRGGVQNNVVPESIEVVIDIRIPPAVREQQFYAMMQDWCDRVGPGVSYKVEYLRFTETHPDALFDPTSTDTQRLVERVWNAFAESVGRDAIAPEIFPGGTDGRYLREQGVPVFGFSPIRRTPILLHCHDEYLPVDVFLEGISVYERLIPALANLPAP